MSENHEPQNDETTRGGGTYRIRKTLDSNEGTEGGGTYRITGDKDSNKNENSNGSDTDSD